MTAIPIDSDYRSPGSGSFRVDTLVPDADRAAWDGNNTACLPRSALDEQAAGAESPQNRVHQRWTRRPQRGPQSWETKENPAVVPDKLNLGAGVLAGTVIGADDGGFGLLYGLTTLGSKDKNLTLGLGWAYANGSIASRPTVSLSGMIRTGPRGYPLRKIA